MISHKSGISLRHLAGDDKTPKIITSIARYYVYYHMQRFLRESSDMDYYITKDMITLIFRQE